MNPRLSAVRVLEGVVGAGQSLSRALPPVLARLEPETRPRVQAWCYGVLRRYFRLTALLDRLLERPLKPRDLDVTCLLLLGLYQLSDPQAKQYAIVDQSVRTARALRKAWAAGLVNGVLRRYLRERERLEAELELAPATRYALPEWFIERLQAAYPEDWPGICEATNRHPPMTLRVNLMQGSREDYLARLAEAGLSAAAHPQVPSAIILERPVEVDALPGFAAGEVSVQDGAAQLAGWLLDVRPGQRVLDACAAPGGKTTHLLEQAGGELELTAVDIDTGRLARVRENLDRLGLAVELKTGDAARPADWWDGRPYDRILLDAPCSATGVIRRNPDIRLHRRAADIDELSRRQGELLAALWPLLKPGGMLLYATCSILPQENDAVVERFLAQEGSAGCLTIDAAWGRMQGCGRQILPGEADMDGFYYACLGKR
ncbi:MAG: 16S rRNA (cytosine(967)-C(5))-methyltransferase RsmB [Gammaproteobacteria bacterium]